MPNTLDRSRKGSRLSVPTVHKAWALYLRDNTRGVPSVRKFYDDDESHSIDVFSSTDTDGVVSATIGLMDIDIKAASAPESIFTEILIDSSNGGDTVGNVLSTVAFYVIKDGWRPAPGAILERMVEMYAPDLAVKHLLFVPPFQWSNNEMTRVELEGKSVLPLLGVPITDSERDFAYEHGSDALERAMEQAGVDIYDWHRVGSV